MIRKNNSFFPLTFFSLSEQIMRRVKSFELKIFQFLVSKKVWVINACSMREFIGNHLIKCNQPSSYLCFMIMDRWTQKSIQNPVKHLRWSILQKYLQTFSCYLFLQNDPSQVFEKALKTLLGHWKVIKFFKQLLKFICFIDSKVVLIGNK